MRMEGARHHARVAQGGHAVDHLVGGLVSERDQQDLARRNRARLDRVRRPVADDARLARARAGQDDERATRKLDGLALGRVQVSQQTFHLPRILGHARASYLSRGISLWVSLLIDPPPW